MLNGHVPYAGVVDKPSTKTQGQRRERERARARVDT